MTNHKTMLIVFAGILLIAFSIVLTIVGDYNDKNTNPVISTVFDRASVMCRKVRDQNLAMTCDYSLNRFDLKPQTIEWDFGDGTHVFGSPVEHTYAAPGQYVLTMKTSWESGTRQIVSKEFSIPPPKK